EFGAGRVGREQERLVARADAREAEELFGVVRLRLRYLHRPAADEGVDGGVAGGHRVAPAGILPGREAQRRQGKGAGVHAKLRIDEHVEFIAANDGGDDRGLRAAAAEALHAVGALRDRARHLVHAWTEVVDEYLEAVAVELGHPTLEVPPAGADVEEPGGEADAQPSPRGRTRGDRLVPPRRDAGDRSR